MTPPSRPGCGSCRSCRGCGRGRSQPLGKRRPARCACRPAFPTAPRKSRPLPPPSGLPQLPQPRRLAKKGTHVRKGERQQILSGPVCDNQPWPRGGLMIMRTPGLMISGSHRVSAQHHWLGCPGSMSATGQDQPALWGHRRTRHDQPSPSTSRAQRKPLPSLQSDGSNLLR